MLRTRAKAWGVSGECCEDDDGQHKSLDDSLLRIIPVWESLPESLRKEVEATCLQPVSRNISK